METMKITETALNTNKVIMPFDRPDIEYNVEKIKPTSFNLFQGIYISENILCIREIDLVFKDGNIFHIDSLKLNI